MYYTDFHSHILPCADHGSDSVETSLYQLNEAKKARVDTIFLTPHFYVDIDSIDEFLIRRDKTFDELMNAVSKTNLRFNFIKSAEVNLQLGLTSIDDLDKLCIENTHYMLLEMPMNQNWSQWVYNSIDELRDRGIEPILAHIDRYDPKLVDPLFDMDVRMQVNASAFHSFFTKRRMMKYIDRGYVCFLGSDIHEHGHHYEDFAKAAHYIGYNRMKAFNNYAKQLLK